MPSAVLAVELVPSLRDALLGLVALDVHVLAGLGVVPQAALGLGRLGRAAAAKPGADAQLGIAL
eukprot:7729411-Alexandrium_andersonii.AAC.1